MKVVKYTLGVLFILGGIGSLLNGAFLAGFLIFILGLLFLPPISELSKEKIKLWQNKAVRYVSYIVLFIIASIFIPKDLDKGADSKIESKKKFIAEYIKKDTLDKSLQNARNLAEIGGLFNNHNFSFEHPKNYISEKYDSINKTTVVIFNPKFNFSDDEKNSYLHEDKVKGKLLDYTIEFTLNDNNEILSKKTFITYSKTGGAEYKNDEVPSLDNFLDYKVIDSKKELAAIEKKALKQKDEHEKRMQKFEEKCLSSWDGSHRELVKLVKQNMHNPKSFEHVDTRYGITGDYAGIVMVYRGTNAFGAIVTNNIKAKVSLEDCSIISVEEL